MVHDLAGNGTKTYFNYNSISWVSFSFSQVWSHFSLIRSLKQFKKCIHLANWGQRPSCPLFWAADQLDADDFGCKKCGFAHHAVLKKSVDDDSVLTRGIQQAGGYLERMGLWRALLQGNASRLAFVRDYL